MRRNRARKETSATVKYLQRNVSPEFTTFRQPRSDRTRLLLWCWVGHGNYVRFSVRHSTSHGRLAHHEFPSRDSSTICVEWLHKVSRGELAVSMACPPSLRVWRKAFYAVHPPSLRFGQTRPLRCSSTSYLEDTPDLRFLICAEKSETSEGTSRVRSMYLCPQCR